jgi:6-methylsalicylic acid synthase
VDALFTTKGVGGYAFPWGLDELRRSADEQLSVLTLEPEPARHAASWAHVVDGALTISAVLVTPEDAHRLWMSSYMGGVAFRGEPPARITVHTRRSDRSPEDTVDVLVADDTGAIVCEVTGLRFAPLQDQTRGAASAHDLVHEIVWRPLDALAGGGTGGVTVDADAGPDSVLAGSGIVLVGDAPEGAALAEQWRRAGVRVTRFASAEDAEPALLAAAGAVVVAPALPGPDEPVETAAEHCAWTLIRTAQRLASARSDARASAAAATAAGAREATPGDPGRAGGAGADPRLWVLTRGVREAADESALAHGPLWGVARIVAGEHPELWGGAVDLGAAPDRADAAALLRVFAAMPGEEDVVSLAGGRLAAPRLAAVDRPAGPPAVQCRPGGTYLVTGGLGGLGLLVAGWLVDRGATRLLLAGRHGLPPRERWEEVTDPALRRRIDGVLALEALGATVRVLEVDIADAAAVAAALAPSAHGLPPVRGVVHAAGAVDDALLGNVDQDGLRRVLAPKADGAMVLHRLFPPGALDFFVLFSSSGQFARLTGQTAYAAANSFLDTLAAHRGAGGGATTSIGWTSWRGVGMSEAIEGTMLEANSRGLEAVSPAEAFRAWAYADRRPAPYQAVLKVLPTAPGSIRPPMLRELTAPDAAAGDDGAGFVLDWDALPEREAREAVALEVRDQVAAELNLAAEEIDFRRPLVELGIDSVMTVALRVRLARRFGLDLPPTVLWDKPTVGALAAHLVEHLRPREEAAPA